MDQKKLDKILKNHKTWVLSDGNDGERANLYIANLERANLEGANLDFSCWPLWCGSKNVKVDLKLIYQLLAHVACLDCNEPEYAKIKKAIMEYAVQSHRAMDLGLQIKEVKP